MKPLLSQIQSSDRLIYLDEFRMALAWLKLVPIFQSTNINFSNQANQAFEKSCYRFTDNTLKEQPDGF